MRRMHRGRAAHDEAGINEVDESGLESLLHILRVAPRASLQAIWAPRMLNAS